MSAAPVEELAGIGNEALQSGRFREAADAFRRLTEVRPDDSSAWHDLGLALLRGHDATGATHAFEQALQLEPGANVTRLNLARARMELGETGDARAQCHRVLARKPEHYAASVLLGRTFELEGHTDEAEKAFRSAARTHPNQAAAWCGLERVGRLRDPESLERFVDVARLPREEESALRFALGTAFDRRGEYDRAFAHFARANALRRTRFVPDERDRLVDAVLRVADADVGGPGGDPSEAPVFLVGLPRSGSSLVEQVLACHPQVHALGERAQLGALACDLGRAVGRPAARFPLGVVSLTEAEATELARQYTSGLPELHPDATRWTDKTVSNVLLVTMIRRMFPNARVVHCVRDERDACLSAYFQDFGDYSSVDFTSDLDHLARYALSHRRLAERWRSAPPLPWHEVRYEDLVACPEPHVRSLLDFLGLPWDARCMEFHTSRRAVATASASQVREPMHTRSVQRWRNYAAYLGPLAQLGAG